MPLLITGARGFVGNNLTNFLNEDGVEWRGTTREKKVSLPYLTIDSIDANTIWDHALDNIDCVIHLAARVHVMHEYSQNAEDEYLRTNYYGTLKLAQDAARRGVKLFIFISSVKVNGEGKSTPYTENDLPSPQDLYGQSKLQAEEGLKEIARTSNMKVVVLRPTLIYGKGVKGNLESLINAISNGLPLPVRGIKNKRSFVYVGNLSNAILTIVKKQDTVQRFSTYLISDGEDISTDMLVQYLAKIIKKPVLRFYVPKFLFLIGEKLLNRPGIYKRLGGDLYVKIDKFCNDFKWKPEYSTYEGLSLTFSKLTPKISLANLITKRFLDIVLSILVISICLLPCLLVAIIVKLTSEGPVLYWSKRIGKDNVSFLMPKFRTMQINTPQLATHLIEEPHKFVTPIGPILRKSSIDEIPQLWNILIGEMSFVGPRPALYNQADLVAARTSHQIERLVPGLTGWAQVNGRDEISLQEKVELDLEYLNRKSILFDLYILYLTFIRVIQSKAISH